MKKYISLIFISFILSGCTQSDVKKDNHEIKEADVSKITVEQGKESVDQEIDKHKEELKKDKKGFYYSYTEGNSSEDKTYTRLDAQKRVKNRVIDGKVAVIEKNSKVDNPYEYVRIDLLKSALSHDFMVKCSACHDDYANGIIGPSLLTKDSDYIFSQMMKYREDPKKNIFMYELVNKMSKEDLKAIAEEISKFNKEVRAIKEGKK